MIAISFAACKNMNKADTKLWLLPVDTTQYYHAHEVELYTFDGCEYFSTDHTRELVHKGNCSNPVELQGHKMERQMGIEPTTSSLEGWRSTN